MTTSVIVIFETYGQDASNAWWRVTTAASFTSASTNAHTLTREWLSGPAPSIPTNALMNSCTNELPPYLLTGFTESLDLLATTNTPARAWTLLDPASAATWTVTEEPGASTPAIRKTTAGRVMMDISSSGVTNLYTYDGFGRQVAATGGRGNTRVTLYNNLSQVSATADFLGDPSQLQLLTISSSLLTNVTVYGYDALGRQTSVTDPLSNTVHTAYDAMGSVIAQWGGAYPVRYTHDPHGRMSTMRTFRSLPADEPPPAHGGDVTEWVYETATGLLLRKRYHGGTAVNHTYTPDGRPLRTTWARGVWKQHHYDALGQLTGITYSDSTPPVYFTYDEAGRLTSVTDASGTRTFTRAPGGRTLTDSIEINGAVYTLRELYDNFGRTSGYTFSNTVDDVSSLVSGMAQSYDFAGRISEISVPGITVPFRYDYLPGSDLVTTLAMPNGVTRETVYEPRRDLPASVTHTNAAGAFLTRRVFTRDAAGRLTGRTQFRLGDITDSLDVFEHNDRSELISAAIGTNSYGYAFDSIGNRERSVENTATNTYTANHLNQYTAIATPEQPDFTPAFDADGNQTLIRTHTGVWQITYNTENRPVCFANTNSQTVVDAGYDYMGRMFSRRVTANGVVTSHECYLYRGYLRIAALDMLDNAATRHTVVWDPTEPSATRPLLLQTPDGWHTYGFDQVKNVTELFDSSSSISVAYDYAPFGAVTASSGSAVEVNPLRFSSEIHDPVIGMAHYNYRPLNHLDGRFMGRDPITERGGINLYGFVGNGPTIKTDFLGQKPIIVKKCHAYLVLGHMKRKKPLQWVFRDDCAYGGVVGCWPESNNPTNLVNRWPDVPAHMEEMFEGNKNTISMYTRRSIEKGSIGEIYLPDFETNFAEAVNNVLSSSSYTTIYSRLCGSQCCCQKVTVAILVTKEKGNEITEGVKAHSLTPDSVTVRTIDCAAWKENRRKQ